MFFGEEVGRIEFTFDMLDDDLAVELRLATGHFADIHVAHFAIGPSLAPVNASLVVVVDFGWGVHIEKSHVFHEEAEALCEFTAFVGGVDLGFARASAHFLFAVAFPCDGTPHANNNGALKRTTFVDGHDVGLVGFVGL